MYIVFDIGGTKTRVGASEDGRTLYDTVIRETPRSFSNGLTMLDDAVRSLTNGRPITAIAGGVAGVLCRETSRLTTAPNLPEWAHKPLRARLQDAFMAPVLIENDAALAGLGEAVCGAGAGDAIVAYLTIGTGIGGARIVHGAIDENIYGFEPGHQIMLFRQDPDGAMRACDLESLASGRTLERKYGKDAFDDPDHPLWKEASYMLACGIYNTVLYWSPTSIVLGGPLFRNTHMLKMVIERLSALPAIFPSMPEIKRSSLEEMSGLHGALALIREKCDLD